MMMNAGNWRRDTWLVAWTSECYFSIAQICPSARNRESAYLVYFARLAMWSKMANIALLLDNVGT